MKKIIIPKIILILIISLLVIPFLFNSNTVNAETKINWDNPSKNGNPYKIQLTDTLNSKLLVDVVSCTGAIDWASKSVTKFAKNLSKVLYKKALNEAKIKFCQTGKKSAISSVAAAYGLNLTDIVKEIDCTKLVGSGDTLNSDKYMSGDADGAIGTSSIEKTPVQGGLTQVSDPNVMQRLEDISESEKKITDKRECLNGIAYTLAKNQLATMTKYTMNWVNSGFNGNPLYVKNVNSFMNNLSDDIVMTELNLFKNQNQYYPYFGNYYNSFLKGYNFNNNFEDNMKQSLSYYLGTGSLGENTAETIRKYSDNFGMGGWDGWLAFTQYDQNNPLGYNVSMSNYLYEKRNNEIENTKEELRQGNGFLSQKKCVRKATTIKRVVDSEGKTKMEEVEDPNKCIEWENITPGTIISEKVSTYLNSEVRQLELADTINESLDILFSSLINTLRNEGLASLTTSDFKGTNNISSRIDIDPETGEVFTSSDYAGKSVDLTKDLGNTYIHETLTNKGNWDAKNNVPRLYPEIGETNTYYVVTSAGNTEIIKDGYNGWSIGDRAFFDGEKWQNWKKGQINPIKKRGVVQIQQDYLVAAKELLSVLPGVMPRLGELDYCIPGPNPSWQSNTSEISTAFTDYLDGLEIDYTPAGGFLGNREYAEIKSPEYNSSILKTYRNMFNGTNIWDKVLVSYPYKSIGFTDELRDSSSSLGWKGSYRDSGEKFSRVEEAIGIVNDLKEKILRELNLFKTKYAVEIESIYGPMRKEFIEKENTDELIPNPAYLEMSQTGLNITKDMYSYNEKILDAIDNYNIDIVEANTNIKKLNVIKDQVSVIIKNAQARRDAKLLEILNRDVRDAEELCKTKQNDCVEEERGYNACLNVYNSCIEEEIGKGTKVLTKAEYTKKYGVCFEEENISFYEDTEITDYNNIGTTERCSDNIDNDLDGLIDIKDNDCFYSNSNGTYIQTTDVCYDVLANNYNKVGKCDYTTTMCSDLSALNFLKIGKCEYPQNTTTNSGSGSRR